MSEQFPLGMSKSQLADLVVDQRKRFAEIEAENEKLTKRLSASLDLLQEARDAICALSTMQIKLHHIRPDLADRMDTVGIRERWEAVEKEGKQ